jgi:hypothetical protein
LVFVIAWISALALLRVPVVAVHAPIVCEPSAAIVMGRNSADARYAPASSRPPSA